MLLLVALAAAAEPPDLTGAWRLVLDVATMAKIPVLGTTKIHTRQVMLVAVSRHPEGFRAHHDTCAFEADTQPSIATTEFPAAFIDAIPAKDYPIELKSTGSGWDAHMDLLPVPVGYDPQAGAFPTSLTAPAVTDWDRDGLPAATVRLHVPLFGAIDVYRAQTSRTILDGRVSSPDLLEGSISVADLQQRTLGASNRLFIQNPELQFDSENSRFRLERVAAGTTCATVVAASTP
ncbi:hypothetical protein LBMAG42_09480 [Deltaproteobacteria bacterium]|nr:hypothetical protein LBMAG42_09480 [Deltaproteobacteria bacterium]